MSAPRVLPLGGTAFTVELGDVLDAEINARVLALDRALARAPFEGYVEAVPTLRSLLVVYDSDAVRPARVARELASRAGESVPATAPAGVLHELPTVYGGDDGPDLAELARERGLSEPALVRLHSSREYTAFMLGFKPGFAYLGLVPGELECGRLATPRVRVPAGSVGVAGRQTGVYPAASPGGWRLVGRTAERLFDPARERPALVAPGDRVRFVPVAELPPPKAPRLAPRGSSRPIARVREPGLLTSVQAAPRVGRRRLGVTGAGPLDAAAHAAANRAVGNADGAPALECTITGPTLEFLAPARFAIAGADLGAVLERADLGAWRVPAACAVLARPGNVLRFEGRRSGCRAYVALAGGLDVPEVLGSRSTDLGAGFGGFEGRALRAGDELGVATPAPLGASVADVSGAARDATGAAADAASATVRVVLGPQADHFAAATLARFLAEPFLLGATSDRVGCRLEGEPLPHAGPAEILSDGMVPGSIQVPPDGRPIVMLGDAPTTGGYPKIATVLAADLKRLAQLVPGEGRVRFEAVRLEDL